jgi:sugar transferase (PEP-CTERM/EpsH1 system associated)
MRLLVLTHRLPYPPNKGDKIRSFNILKRLAAKHTVWLGCVIDEERDLRFIDNVRDLVQGLVFSAVHPRLKRVSSLSKLLLGKPISVAYFYSGKLQEEIDDIIATCNVEAVFCYSTQMVEYVIRSKHYAGKLGRVAKVVDLIDVDSYKWTQYAERSSGFKRWLYRYEAKQLARYEAMVVGVFSDLLLVSEQEKRIFSRVAPIDHVTAMPNGVDLDFFYPVRDDRPMDRVPTIVFTGVMDYWPNVEGVAWFVEKIFPRIRDRVPQAAFDIVGAKPTAQVMKLQAVNGVRVTGYVEDVREYLRNADVCVVPLRIARGLQNKVLEAMAMGKPVIGTPEALEGIRAVAGEDVFQAKTPETLAEAVIDLLTNRAKADAVGRRARLCVEQSYSWERNLEILDEIIDRSHAQASKPVSIR